jgi:hypothetical protein
MKLARTLIAALAMAAAGAAQASVVSFADTSGGDGIVSTKFADGAFTHHTDPVVNDGFYAFGTTSATNLYGYNNEAILFNQDVTLHSLQLGGLSSYKSDAPGATPGATLSASLYDGGNNLLAFSTIDSLENVVETLAFDMAHTRKLVLSFTGGVYNQATGLNSVWYLLDNVTYSVEGASTTTPSNDVPEPAPLALFGLGAAALALARRRKSA